MNSDVLEVFIAPVKVATDVPSFYHEIDTGAAGALWAACINNAAGNVTTQTCDPPQTGTLNCTGAADFERGLHAKVKNSTGTPGSGWWATDLTIPWAIFAPWAQPAVTAEGTAAVPWPHWRFNLYRYSYPDGPNAGFSNYELNAWSPPHTGSFHTPSRFGFGVLVPKANPGHKTDDTRTIAPGVEMPVISNGYIHGVGRKGKPTADDTTQAFEAWFKAGGRGVDTAHASLRLTIPDPELFGSGPSR